MKKIWKRRRNHTGNGRIPCQRNKLSSRMCRRGTKGCENPRHYDKG
jgi:hypothetical protein